MKENCVNCENEIDNTKVYFKDKLGNIYCDIYCLSKEYGYEIVGGNIIKKDINYYGVTGVCLVIIGQVFMFGAYKDFFNTWTLGWWIAIFGLGLIVSQFLKVEEKK